MRPALLALGGLLAMAGAVGIGRFIYTPILPAMILEMGLTTGQAGLIASANYLGYLAGALAASSSHFPGNHRSWLLIALTVSAVTTGGMGLAQSLALCLGLRFLGGVASAVVLILSSALVLERLGATGHARLSAVHFAGVGTGISISALFTWGITALSLDWRSMWIGGGLISFMAVLAVALLIRDDAPQTVPKSVLPVTSRNPRVYPLVIAYGLFGFGYVITATFIVAIVRGAPELRNIEPIVWLVFGLSAAPSVAAWTMLGRRYGVIRVFQVACVVESIGVVSSVAWVSVPGLFVAAAFLGGTFMGITALGLMAARDLSGGNARATIAMMTAAFGIGQIVGPLVAGYTFDWSGGFLFSSIAAAVALCIGAAVTHSVERS